MTDRSETTPHYELKGVEILEDGHPVIKFYAGSARPYCNWKEKAIMILDALNAPDKENAHG